MSESSRSIGGTAAHGFTPLNKDDVKQRLVSTVTDAELDKVCLFIRIKNFYQALDTREAQDRRLPRNALEFYGLDKDVSFGIQFLASMMMWAGPPTFKLFMMDKDVDVCWKSAEMAAQGICKERWESLRDSVPRPEPLGQPYDIDDFLYENPEWDRTVEDRYQSVTDAGIRQVLMQNELDRRAQDLKFDKLMREMRTLSQRRPSRSRA